jgi:hypothetical protein
MPRDRKHIPLSAVTSAKHIPSAMKNEEDKKEHTIVTNMRELTLSHTVTIEQDPLRVCSCTALPLNMLSIAHILLNDVLKQAHQTLNKKVSLENTQTLAMSFNSSIISTRAF